MSDYDYEPADCPHGANPSDCDECRTLLKLRHECDQLQGVAEQIREMRKDAPMSEYEAEVADAAVETLAPMVETAATVCQKLDAGSLCGDDRALVQKLVDAFDWLRWEYIRLKRRQARSQEGHDRSVSQIVGLGRLALEWQKHFLTYGGHDHQCNQAGCAGHCDCGFDELAALAESQSQGEPRKEV